MNAGTMPTSAATSSLIRVGMRSEQEIRSEERRRIGRDLHDSTSQLLVALRLSLGCLKERMSPQENWQVFSVLDSTLDELHDEVRALSDDDSEPRLRPGELPFALRAMARRFGQMADLQISVDVRGEYVPLPASVEVTLYRIAQEALANVKSHAQAQTVRISLRSSDRSLRLTIDDDGIGVGTKPLSANGRKGAGLQNIKQRVRELKGRVILERLALGSRLSVSLSRTMP